MNTSRWMALLVAGLYVAACLWFPGGADGADGTGQRDSTIGKGFGLILLVLGFICVWWSEILGDALWMGRGAWNPKPSSGAVIAVLGWIFLASAMALCLAADRIIPAAMGTHWPAKNGVTDCHVA